MRRPIKDGVAWQFITSRKVFGWIE